MGGRGGGGGRTERTIVIVFVADHRKGIVGSATQHALALG
jgi:hypothetical protein